MIKGGTNNNMPVDHLRHLVANQSCRLAMQLTNQ